MRRIVAFVLLACLTVGCFAAAPLGGQSGASGGTGGSGATGDPGDDGLPDPDERIPTNGRRLALVLEDTMRRNRDAVDAWTGDGDPSRWPPPADVELLTLYEQRILRLLSAHPPLADRVLDRLPHREAVEAGRNVRAGHALFEHATPLEEVPDFRIRDPEGADALLGYFREAEERFDVAWEVLAGIMLIETRMGRVRSRSSAGAQGPMQFLPSTWEAYGLGGDVHDPRDAVLGAANYLRASGAPGDYRQALYRYNPVNAYVTAVWQYAKTMMRSPESYYAYYNWQVFVRTVDGDVQLSGPGL